MLRAIELNLDYVVIVLYFSLYNVLIVDNNLSFCSNVKLATRMANIGKIEEFQTGDDWEVYKECLQQYLKANGIKDADRVAVFLTVIGNTLYKLLRNLTSPDKPADNHMVIWQGTSGSKTNFDYRKSKISQEKPGESIDHFQ